MIATPATIRSHAYLRAINDEDPCVRVIEHATPTLVPFVEAGEPVRRRPRRRPSPRRSRRCSTPSDAPIDTLLLGCTHYPLLRPIIAALAGPQVAIVDSATATASALAELLDINGLRSRDQDRRRRRRPTGRRRDAATHRQLTTGDPETFHALASRLFGSAFPDVERIDLAVPAR